MSLEHTRALLEHKELVAHYLNRITHELALRGIHHDDSKFSDEEYEAYSKLAKECAEVPFGSSEHKSIVRKYRPAVEHHFAANPHHPDYHEAGVAGMTLVDLVEMLCDWKAASQRPGGTPLKESLPGSIKHFKIEPQLASVLENTIHSYFSRED